MLVVVDFVWSIDTSDGLEVSAISARVMNANCDKHARLDAIRDTLNVEGLKPGQAQTCGIFPILELKWKDSHTYEIASVNTFEGLGQNCLNAK